MASPSDRTHGARGADSGTPATRTAERPKQRASQARIGHIAADDSVDDSGRVAQVVATATKRGVRLTWRAVALLMVLVLLIYTYGNSLRVYFNQQAQIAAAKAEIQANQQAIDSLYEQLLRWQDPAYVKAQARERLGWVVPGEIGFQVIGPDGQPLGGGASIGASSASSNDNQADTWWGRLAGSIAAADAPEPLPGDATPPPPPITVTPPPR